MTPAALSPQQQQVVDLVARGYSDKLIARRLNIGERTVRYHLAGCRRKLRATSRANLAALAVAHGLVKFDTVSVN